MTAGPDRYEVDPARLSTGTWSAEFNTKSGEGDIAASYSGDTIGLRSMIREPFVFRGELWVCVGLAGDAARAYRAVPMEAFTGASVSIEEVLTDSEAAREGREGFYHGVAVRYRYDWFVLVGPPATFEPGGVVQPGLFGEPSR